MRGNSVNDDTCGYAVLTDPGASASHMTPAQVLDLISRTPGMSGEADDAVSAHIQVKMSDASKLLKLPETECPTLQEGLEKYLAGNVFIFIVKVSSSCQYKWQTFFRKGSTPIQLSPDVVNIKEAN